MQNEITKPSKCFWKNGALMQRGWARRPLLEYNREDIAANWYRIKEWSHYSILDKDQGWGVQITLGDIGYFTLMGFVFIDFKEKRKQTYGSVRFLTKGKGHAIKDSMQEGDIWFPARNFSAVIKQRPKQQQRILSFNCPRAFAFKGFKGNIVLHDDPNDDNTIVATGYKESHKLFYYNHKINYMPCDGWFIKGGKRFKLNPNSSFGLLDFGLGVWPYRTHWRWASANGLHKGVPVSWNLGNGFGDLSTHTENIVFYDGKAHKLDQIEFIHENRNPYKPWRLKDNEGRFDMVLRPIGPKLCDYQGFDIGFMMTHTSMFHGFWSGYCVLDDGTKLEIKDFLGHAEDIFFKW